MDWILYVEDDEMDHMLFEEAIKAKHPNYILKICHNGEEAIKLLNEIFPVLPSMIFSDINMPRLNGFEFLKKFNDESKFSTFNIPFIFLSNSNDPNDIKNAFALNAKGYFRKLINPNQYANEIDCIISYWEKWAKAVD